MKDVQMIGEATAEILKRYLAAEEAGDGIARFLLDCLNGDQVTAICNSITADPHLAAQCKIQIPRSLVLPNQLPEEMLTDERTVRLRNMPCEHPVLILANTNDDQGQSLKDITKLGSPELIDKVEVWVDVASKGLTIPSAQTSYWKKALAGLQKANPCSLEEFAKFVALTRLRVEQEGVPVVDALGWALPAIRLPRDSGYFSSIPEKNWNQTKKWQDLFQQAFSKRGCLLRKETTSRKVIEKEELEFSYLRVQDQISPDLYPTILEFINSPAGWNPSAEALASYEWENQQVSSIFSGLKTRKMNLSQETLKFFSDEYEDSLSDQDEQYLESLSRRGTKEPNEYDLAFYESHSHELEENRLLKSKWDRFVYGQPIDCTDFLAGLLKAIERLMAQSSGLEGTKTLTISTAKEQQKSKWLQINADVGLFFCTRYRGLQQLTCPQVIWETHWLFKYDELLEKSSKDKKYKRNTSAAKSATEIKFYLELTVGESTSRDKLSVQLNWKCNPLSIGMELNDDLKRLNTNSPVMLSQVYREPTNKKGRLQGISLEDVGTLAAVFRMDRGSLIAKYDKKQDLVKQIPDAIKSAKKTGGLSEAIANSISSRWDAFVAEYTAAINEYLNGAGLASNHLVVQAERYAELLTELTSSAFGDTNRTNLYEPILEIGCIRVGAGEPSAIIAPWHPLRMAAACIKASQVVGLINYVLSAPCIEFGDSRLFFADLRNELEHPYYPEVCIGYLNRQPVLLTITDTCNDYSLMEQPVRVKDADTTNENPSIAAAKLISLTERYLELLPHEQTNLSLVLYNCDSIKLPQAVVSKLTDLHDDMSEARCQVILRHTEQKNLSDLYQQLVGNSENDPDAFIASEAAKDFIARLRIGVKAEAAGGNGGGIEGKSADIVFLQNVVSRQATLAWTKSNSSGSMPELMEHVPSRWSRKKPASFDDLKSTVYLTCPIQPRIGVAYLNAVYSAVNSDDVKTNEFYLPARQISFKDDTTQKILEDVHQMGEWVANYDELVEKRQLMNQGIRVIRYQQNRNTEQNFLVSSTSRLNLLNVLVKRRLEALNLKLLETEQKELAERLIEEANGLSGDIVLRAAKSGKFASELIGVALSKILVKDEFGSPAALGWFFLDDYATWLGQKEEQIADILGVALRQDGDQRFMQLIITESKFVDAAGVADAKKTSQKQLRDTIDRIGQAIFYTPERLDRDLWLSRIGDLLINGVSLPPSSTTSLEEWHEDLRSGTLALELRGYSHVFVSGSNEAEIDCEASEITKIDNCWQEVFNREKVRQLLQTYYENGSSKKIREQVHPAAPWKVLAPRLPAPRVNWVKAASLSSSSCNNKSQGSVEEKSDNLHSKECVSKPIGGGITSSPEESSTENVSRDSEKSEDETPKTDLDHNYPAELAEWLGQTNTTTVATPESTQWLTQTVTGLSMALLSYNLQCKVLGQRLTPNAALIRLKGSDRLTIDDLERRSSQLLTTHGINVISVFAQPGEILLYVARPAREMVSLRDIWLRRKINRDVSGINMSFVIGIKELDGELLYLNLARPFEGLEQHAPHTLIAGATGSGKSVLLQNLLLDICATNKTEQAQIFLIDPKAGVDYVHLEGLPHLTRGIIVQQEIATEVMEALVAEMDRRYLLFREHKVKDLTAFNANVTQDKRLPVLFLVHDEFAEWMLVEEYKDNVSSIVQRLGVKARAAGIHLIFAAQRPDAHVLPVQLRDNLGNRLILRVESTGTSEIALGQKGAEKLLGKGHLAARLSGESDIIYAQVPFLSDQDLQRVTSNLTPH